MRLERSGSWLPILAEVLLALIVLSIALARFYVRIELSEAPLVLGTLNTLFLCALPLVIAYLASKSWERTGAVGFLYLGSGLVSFGVASLLAGWVMPLTRDPNNTVTVHNIGCLVSGCCQVAGAHCFLRDIARPEARRPAARSARFAYAAVAAAMGVVALLAVAGLLPPFFTSAGGPSPFRQIVLGSSVLLYAAAGFLFLEIWSAAGTGFARWFGLALWYVAAGLAAVFLQRRVGDLVGWTGRIAQYLSGVLLVVAYLLGKREWSRGRRYGAADSNPWLWPYLERKILERTAALARQNESLRRELDESVKTAGELALSEERFRSLVTSTGDLVFTLDREGRFQGLYGRWSEETRRDPELLAGRKAYEIFSDGSGAFEAASAQAIAGEHAFFEWTFTDWGGAARRVHASLSPVRDRLGAIRGLVGIGRNVTDLNFAEERLVREYERFAAASRSARVGVWDWDIVSGGLFWSPELFAIYGLEPGAEPSFELYYGIIHPEDLAEVRRIVDEVLRARGPFRYEYRIRRPSGETRWIINLGETEFDRAGKARRLVGVSVDVTDRKRVEETLRESVDQLRRAAEASCVGTFIYDFETDQGMMSPELKSLLGLEQGGPQDFDTRSILAFLSPDSLAEFQEQRSFVFDPACGRWDKDFRIALPNGAERWLHVSCKIDFVSRNGALAPQRSAGAVADVTARVQSDRKLARLLAEKDILLREVNHRVKNSLSLVSSLLHLQAASVDSPERAVEAFKESGDRILAIARVHEELYLTGEPGRVVMGPYLRRLLPQIQRTLCTDDRVGIEIDVEDLLLDAGAAIPCGIILNELVTNACKHAFPEGRPGLIRIGFKSVGDSLELRVADDGVGMAPGVGDGKPRALGLKLVRLLASQLEGSVELVSERGLACAVRFPARPQTP